MPRLFFASTLASIATCSYASATPSTSPTGIAVGSQAFSNSSEDDKSLIAIRQAGETQWKVVNTPNPQASRVMLKNASCNGQTCVALGDNGYARTTSLVIYVSHDSGNTWKIAPSPEMPNWWGYFNDVKCLKNNVCLIVGGVSAGHEAQKSQPFVLRSSDAGDTWTMLENLPAPGNDTNLLYSVDCSENSCIAAGLSQIDGKPAQNLLLKSDDQGQTWKQVRKEENDSYSALYSITHIPATNQFVAVGTIRTYLNNEIKWYPIALYSQNDGENWTEENIQTGKASSLFTSISCTQSYCIAAGRDETNNRQRPLAFKQLVGFKTWAPVKVDTIFGGVSCNGAECTAAGGENIGVSGNEGQSWNTEQPYFMTQPKHYDLNSTTLWNP